MAQMAIQVLWFLIGLIVLCGVVYLAIYVVEMFVMPIPEKIKQGIWVIILLLALIALLTVLVGGGGGFRFPAVRGEFGGAIAAFATGSTGDLSRVLGLKAERS